MLRGQTVILYPTEKQEKMFRKCLGLARFSYNYVKSMDDNRVKEGLIRLSYNEMAKELVKLKKTEGYEWMKELPCDVHKQAALDFAQAKARSKKRVGHQGQTRYKSKKDPIQSFYCEYNKTKAIKGKKVFISKIGEVKTSRQMPRGVGLHNPRVIRKGNKWYLSFGIEKAEVKKELTDEVVGVDMGLTHLAITSEGKKYDNPNRSKKIRDLEKRKKEYQKMMNRRYDKEKKISEQSKGYYRAKAKHADICEKLTNIRKDIRHKISRDIVNTRAKTIVLEDLNIQGMMKNKKLSKAIGDAGWYTLGMYIKYKAEEKGTKVVKADRFYASSRICSCCGEKKQGDFSLSIREWKCPNCKAKHDRDINAAINLKQYPTL